MCAPRSPVYCRQIWETPTRRGCFSKCLPESRGVVPPFSPHLSTWHTIGSSPLQNHPGHSNHSHHPTTGQQLPATGSCISVSAFNLNSKNTCTEQGAWHCGFGDQRCLLAHAPTEEGDYPVLCPGDSGWQGMHMTETMS